MKDPLGVSPSKGNQGTTRGKEKILLTSVGIEPTPSGPDLPQLCRLSYEAGQRKSGTIMVANRGEEIVFIVLRGTTFICTVSLFSLVLSARARWIPSMVPSFKNTASIFPEISFIQYFPPFSCRQYDVITDLIYIIEKPQYL